jgi:polyisoprenoid-binding protein YceI
MNALLSTLSVAGLAGVLASSSGIVPASLAGPIGTRAPETYEVDATHSFVSFRTLHMGLSSAVGTFDRIAADKSSVTFDADLGKSSIVLVVDASSVSTGNPKRDEHLRNADFFSTKEFPEIVFESQKITGSEEQFEVAGDLTFHGVTKPVTAKGRQVGRSEDGKQAGFSAEFTIDLAEFGVEIVKKNPGSVGPDVTITIDLRCARE